MVFGPRNAKRRGVLMGAAIASSRNKKKMAAVSASQPTQPAPAPATTQDSVKLLKDLGELRDAGILTEEEFSAKKKQILGL